MAEFNPHRKIARTFAFACYVLSGLVLVASVFFTLAAATVDMSKLPLRDGTNQQMALLTASFFLIIVVMIVLVGWRVQSLFGQPRRRNKLAAKAAVGCLNLGSLGCGLWTVLSAAITLVTGVLITGEPAGCREIFVGASGSILLIFLLLAFAWFIAKYYATPNLEEQRRAFERYKEAVRPYLTNLAEPQARTYVQDETMEFLAELDTSLKSSLLVFLVESGLLKGDAPIALQGADFRRVDLSSINLPRADLHGINLERAILRDAVLFKTNLQNARLKNADLTRANLQQADLRQADFSGAVLEEADLSEANLTGTRLTPKQRNQAGLGERTS